MRCGIKQRRQPSQKSLKNHAEADIQKKIKNIHDDLRYQTRVTTITEIIEKSFKNLPKINQNPSKMNKKSIKIKSWDLLGPKRPQDSPKTFKNLPKINQNPSKINHKSIKINSWAPKGPKTFQSPLQAQKQEHFPNPSGLGFGRHLEPC